ncbi:hypothetical protein ACFYM0_31890 [Streptomyces sp. NPDC006487]|uniref:hypothetical protein n=1 Tax=Streptomyces sp. NPDC006487 TaxID=3364748 RepID=UPI0036CD326C
MSPTPHLERSEGGTLAACAGAPGGGPKIVAEFGDERYALGRQRPRPRIGGSIRGRGRA